MRRSGRKNTFDSGIFTRVWCLASGAKTRVAGLLYNTFEHRFSLLLFWRVIDWNGTRVHALSNGTSVNAIGGWFSTNVERGSFFL